MSVSTHVLDASLGVPAAGVPVALARLSVPGPGGPAGPGAPTGAGAPAGAGQWAAVESGVTDADGRHRFGAATPAGVYRLTFTTGAYFAARAVAAFYPEVAITFTVTEPANTAANGKASHFHVPLLLSPFAYSTYRGS